MKTLFEMVSSSEILRGNHGTTSFSTEMTQVNIYIDWVVFKGQNVSQLGMGPTLSFLFKPTPNKWPVRCGSLALEQGGLTDVFADGFEGIQHRLGVV